MSPAGGDKLLDLVKLSRIRRVRGALFTYQLGARSMIAPDDTFCFAADRAIGRRANRRLRKLRRATCLRNDVSTKPVNRLHDILTIMDLRRQRPC